MTRASKLLRDRTLEGLEPDPAWYKSGVIYEVHVRAFYDTNGDGIGDFRGLTEKLDYIKDLGVTAIWLLPFYPSPLKDDGYDIANYCAVHPIYGTLSDFKLFLREAHHRGLRVITELALNHTSDQHPWFQRARRAKPGSRWRNFYVWSDTATEYRDARIIFKDVEVSNWSWDSVANAYFWHRFFSHQPDLNFESEDVHAALFRVVDFWLDLGVDGLRLDAVPYLYEREGTSCENLPETHAFLKRLRRHVDENYQDRMLLGEANQWPEDAVSYFGKEGDECHMAYHFPLMPRLFMSVRMEDRQPIVDILEQTPPIPEKCQWALFLRNHDELTLEMVTDEERDYMYRMYAHVDQARLNLGIRRRLAPLMNNDRKSIELLNALLFSLPGTPVLYYGDEIGLGENIFLGDRNGVRTPMQWSSDKNAGFSRANPQSLYLPIILDPGYHYEADNVEVQLANPHSLLWWMRRLLALRKRWRALGEGKCEFLQTENRKILSYVLRFQNETLLVVANLSRFPQPVDLDLSAFAHTTPTELFGRTEFPVVGGKPYFLSLGPHSFFWFSLEQKTKQAQLQSSVAVAAPLPLIAVGQQWKETVTGRSQPELRAALPDFLRNQTWFKGKSKTIKSLSVREAVTLKWAGDGSAMLTLVQLEYVDADTETYLLPLSFATGTEAADLRQRSPHRILAELRMKTPEQSGLLYDALGSAEFCAALLDTIWRSRGVKGAHGELEPVRLPEMHRLMGKLPAPKPSATRYERSNSCVVFEDKLLLKVFRRLEPGRNPELEVGRFLNTRSFGHCQTVAGGLEYIDASGLTSMVATVHAYIPAATTAWDFALDAVGRYYDRVMTWVAQGAAAAVPTSELVRLLQPDIPPNVTESIGTFLESARLLGVRLAELHQALGPGPAHSEFAAEPSTPHHRRGLFQSMRNLAVQNLRALRKRIGSLPARLKPMAQKVADLEPAALQGFRALSELRSASKRIRLHGDCRLQEVLWTGKDFVFIDFEGDASMPLSERRLKHSPLRDAATMLRSFHQAAFNGLDQHMARGSIPPENMVQFQSWLQYWYLWVSVAFLKAYLQSLIDSGLVPSEEEPLRVMLRAYVLDRAMSELGRALAQEDAQLEVTLTAILFILHEPIPSDSPEKPLSAPRAVP